MSSNDILSRYSNEQILEILESIELFSDVAATYYYGDHLELYNDLMVEITTRFKDLIKSKQSI